MLLRRSGTHPMLTPLETLRFLSHIFYPWPKLEIGENNIVLLGARTYSGSLSRDEDLCGHAIGLDEWTYLSSKCKKKHRNWVGRFSIESNIQIWWSHGRYLSIRTSLFL